MLKTFPRPASIHLLNNPMKQALLSSLCRRHTPGQSGKVTFPRTLSCQACLLPPQELRVPSPGYSHCLLPPQSWEPCSSLRQLIPLSEIQESFPSTLIPRTGNTEGQPPGGPVSLCALGWFLNLAPVCPSHPDPCAWSYKQFMIFFSPEVSQLLS